MQIGINPGLMAAYIGRWFPGPGNHFCKSSFSDSQMWHCSHSVLTRVLLFQGSVCSCLASLRSSSTTCMTLCCQLSTRWASRIWWRGPHLVARTCLGMRPHPLNSRAGCRSSFLNVVCDLGSKELREGGKILVEKLKKFRPLIAVFNGKCKRFALAPMATG